jgi:ribosomal protein S18 acetylase RimI-like enzyme
MRAEGDEAMQIRHANASDIDLVAPLLDAYRQFYGQAPDLARASAFLRERFAHHESIVFVAVDAGGAACGFTQLYPLFSTVRTTRTYLLNDLFVAPTARRRRVGAKLLAAAADFARAKGASALSLQTAVNNASAQALYASLGWKRDDAFCEYTLSL